MTKRELTLALAQADAVIRWASLSLKQSATLTPEYEALIKRWAAESRAV